MSTSTSFRRAALVLAGLLGIVPLSAQQVVFTEVMYNPLPGSPEFVEILNNTATPLDMALWRIKDGIDYTFPDFTSGDPQASFMRAYERLIVASVPEAAFREAYPEIPDDIRIFGPWDGVTDGLRVEGFLDNAGERITLVDKNGSLRCSLEYEDDGPWSVAADGGGHSLHVINPNRLIDDFHNWRASAEKGGSPGRPDPEPSRTVVMSEVRFDAEGKLAWVEVYNTGDASVDLSPFAVATDALAVRVSLSGTVAPGAYASHDVGLEGVEDGKVFLVDADDNVLDAHVFKRSTVNAVYQTYPAGSSEWYLTDASTRDAANTPVTRDEVVISEIMFAPPIGSAGEFVELHNRSDATVDIGGWQLDVAIRYTFPAGTSIPARGYLVVAGNLAWFNEHYTDVPALGDFDGGLNNDGELIRLLDATGNLADEVDYGVGGVWPWETDDFGSSLELIHPDMDNNRPSAWKASDESSKSEMREYSVTLPYHRPEWQAGGPGGDQELHFHLVGEGYLILDQVEFKKPGGLFNPNPENLIENGDQESQTGRSDDGWLFQGTHGLGYLEGTQLHIISTGRGDNRANRVEIDLQNLGNSSSDITLSFQARWIYGKPRLIAQTIDHGWSYEFLIDEPTDLGTPGAPNTADQAEPMPQVDYLLHSPAVPKSTDDIVITAEVHSATPLQTVRVAYIDDSEGGNQESLFRQWRRDPMSDDGTNGDAVAGDGIYTFRMQGNSSSSFKKDGAIVVFYVEVIAENGQICTVPPLGSERPALYVVDDQQINSQLRTMRIVMSEFDTGAFGHNGNRAKYEFKYPSSSNYYRNCTIIMNESEIFYNSEARSGGSPWHENDRANLALKGKYKMPKSNAWRGIIKNTYDQDASIADRRHNDRLTRYWLYLFGHPANDNEFIQVMVNDSSPQLREEVEPVDNTFLNRHFEDGSNGQLFRVDDQWMFTDTWGRTPRDASWDYKSPAGERAGRYHSEYMLRSREVEYDYSAIIELFRTATENTYTEEQISRMADIDMIALNFAVRGYIGDWDFISLNRGKNTFFYRQPDDGRFMFLHWDSDLAFQNTGEGVIAGIGTALRNFHTKSYFRQKFNHYLNVLLDEYKVSGPRVNTWLEMEDSAVPDISANISKYRSWESGRASRIRSTIGNAISAPFEVVTQGGNNFDTTDDVISLEGTADATVYEVILLDDEQAEMEWIDETTWRLSDIVLREGPNNLRIRAIDRNGKLIGSLFSPKSIDLTVTKTTPSKPIVHIEADPASYNVSLSQELQLDAGTSYDPEGDPLTFAWEGSTPIGYGMNVNGDRARIVFDMPGIYTFQVTASDGDGNSKVAQREAAVYGPEGFSNFTATTLESFWQTENVGRINTEFQKTYYQLDDREGFLMVQVLGSEDDPAPLALPNDSHPALLRAVPAEADWAFQTKYVLTTSQLGDFKTGAVVLVENGDATERYFFGHDQGTHLAVFRMNETGPAAKLEEMGWERDRATVRIRRVGNQLQFHYQQPDDTWQVLHTETLDAAAQTTQAGLFVATDDPIGVKIGFDYAMLVEPGSVSSLQKDLRLTEIMYNPEGGQEYEFLEFFNSGSQPLDLTGARFSDGIDYTFGEVMLQPGAYLILAKEPAAFANRYGDGLNVAEGGYGGQLANGGETVTLVDSQNLFILSVTYSDGGDWPAAADGAGSSLELIDIEQGLSSQNWQASSEINGTPGRGTEPPSEDDKDADGMLDEWEIAHGLDPDNAQDAFEDLDGDGWNNREEFISGTDPDDSTSYLAVSIARVVNDTVELTFNGLAGRAYTVEYTDALDSNTWIQSDSMEPETDGDVLSEAAAGDGERYFRVSVRQAP